MIISVRYHKDMFSTGSTILQILLRFLLPKNYIYFSIAIIQKNSTNVVGNKTFCDMCQSKTYRKQRRHKQDQKSNDGEGHEETADGTNVNLKFNLFDS
jgi:hypothetical protein